MGTGFTFQKKSSGIYKMPPLVYSLALLFSVFVSQYSHAIPEVPDPQNTPGSLCTVQDKDFKEFRYEEQIAYCKRNVSRGFKKYIYALYRIPKKCRKQYTIDHLLPLAIGGNNNLQNLWPEHKAIKSLRQNLEFNIYMKLKKTLINQQEAIDIVMEAKVNPPIEDLPPGNYCPSNFTHLWQ